MLGGKFSKMAGSDRSKQSFYRNNQQRHERKILDQRNRRPSSHSTSNYENQTLGNLNLSHPNALAFSGPRQGPSHRREEYEDLYDGEQGGDNRKDVQTTDQEQSRQSTYSNGFTVVPPNEEKRKKILQQAEQNMQQYEQLKKENLMKYDQEPPAAPGGVKLSKEELLRQREETQKQVRIMTQRQKLEKQKKREKWAAEKRAKEEQEINERKQQARQQALKNEEKKRQEHMQRKSKLDEERRRQNLRFFEQKFKGNGGTQASDSSERVQKTTDNLARVSLGESKAQWQDGKELKKLQSLFPDIERDTLRDIYMSTCNSFETTVAILSQR